MSPPASPYPPHPYAPKRIISLSPPTPFFLPEVKTTLLAYLQAEAQKEERPYPGTKEYRVWKREKDKKEKEEVERKEGKRLARQQGKEEKKRAAQLLVEAEQSGESSRTKQTEDTTLVDPPPLPPSSPFLDINDPYPGTGYNPNLPNPTYNNRLLRSYSLSLDSPPEVAGGGDLPSSVKAKCVELYYTDQETKRVEEKRLRKEKRKEKREKKARKTKEAGEGIKSKAKTSPYIANKTKAAKTTPGDADPDTNPNPPSSPSPLIPKHPRGRPRRVPFPIPIPPPTSTSSISITDDHSTSVANLSTHHIPLPPTPITPLHAGPSSSSSPSNQTPKSTPKNLYTKTPHRAKKKIVKGREVRGGKAKWDSENEEEAGGGMVDEKGVIVEKRVLKQDLITQEGGPNTDWKLLVIVILLNVTNGKNARPVFDSVIAKWPIPEALAQADRTELRKMIEHLGLGEKRPGYLIDMSKQYCGSVLWEPSPQSDQFASQRPVPVRAVPVWAAYGDGGSSDIEPDDEDDEAPFPIKPKPKSKPKPKPLISPSGFPSFELPLSETGEVTPTSVLKFMGIGKYGSDSFGMFSTRLKGGGAPSREVDWIDEGTRWERLRKGDVVFGEDKGDVWREIRPFDKELIRYMKYRWGIEGIKYSTTANGPLICEAIDRSRLGIDDDDNDKNIRTGAPGDMIANEDEEEDVKPELNQDMLAILLAEGIDELEED